MAVGAGYDVVTTCSPHNFDYVRGLGAGKVFDYRSPTVTQDVVAELDKGECVGIYLPEALAKGVYKIAPPPRVVNRKGLEGVQEALDLIKAGEHRRQSWLLSVLGHLMADRMEKWVAIPLGCKYPWLLARTESNKQLGEVLYTPERWLRADGGS